MVPMPPMTGPTLTVRLAVNAKDASAGTPVSVMAMGDAPEPVPMRLPAASVMVAV
jgi:hypothetical protein